MPPPNIPPRLPSNVILPRRPSLSKQLQYPYFIYKKTKQKKTPEYYYLCTEFVKTKELPVELNGKLRMVMQ
jgi:hypothetical protein